MAAVIIGVDPHKLSATIEVLDERERVLGGGRFGTDRDGFRQMPTAARRWPHRVWAVEGSNGIGRHVAQRLVAEGESVGVCCVQCAGTGLRSGGSAGLLHEPVTVG